MSENGSALSKAEKDGTASHDAARAHTEEKKDGNKEKKKGRQKKTPERVYITPYLGRYKNVRLTATDLACLKAEFPDDHESRIEELSEYIASVGDRYDNHAAAIRRWAKNGKVRPKSAFIAPLASPPDVSDDPDEYMKAAMLRAKRYLEEIESG